MSHQLKFNLVWVTFKAADLRVIISCNSVVIIDRSSSVGVSKLLVGLFYFVSTLLVFELTGKKEDRQVSRLIRNKNRMKRITIKRRYFIRVNFWLLGIWLLLVGLCHFFSCSAFRIFVLERTRGAETSIKRGMEKI